MDLSEFNIAIVGLGLIGGTYAEGIKKLNPKNLWGIDLSNEVLKKAVRKGIIDEGFTNPSEILSECDLVYLTIYPEATERFIIDNMDEFKSGAVITDGVGIKAHIVNTVLESIRDDIDFIGGHPMAGKEDVGLDHAEIEMFKGANYIITPNQRNKEKNILLIEKIAKAIGFGNVVRTTPEIHDENIAYVSQLPHIVAVGMVNCKDIDDVDFYAGGSYRDTTRIAKINSELWTELFIKNREKLVEQIDLFLDYTKNLRDAIDDEDEEKVKAILHESFEKKKVKANY
ncbi:MAG: prephenate dehydrogenase [Andreesenia angusta]|nr:prephenate dehydrogenase [Andreesenia angusta]